MNTLKDLLKEMLDCAETKNLDRVQELDKEFNDDVLTSIPNYSEYDCLRQSCVLSIVHPHMRKEYLQDARERFKKLYSG